MPEKGKQLDLTSRTAPRDDSEPEGDVSSRFLGVHFVCCDVYSRVYANRDQTAYVGHCPRCAKQVRFAIGQGGTDARFFKAY